MDIEDFQAEVCWGAEAAGATFEGLDLLFIPRADQSKLGLCTRKGGRSGGVGAFGKMP